MPDIPPETLDVEATPFENAAAPKPSGPLAQANSEKTKKRLARITRKMQRAQMQFAELLELAGNTVREVMESTDTDDEGRPIYSGKEKLTAANIVLRISAVRDKQLKDFELGKKTIGPPLIAHQTNILLNYSGTDMSEEERALLRKMRLAQHRGELPSPEQA